MKILIIEDQPAELKLAHHVLSGGGHDVTDAGAAEQAFDSIKADRPELIMVDLGLPVMDGLTLIKLLKADPDTRDILIVAVTSYPDKFTKDKAMAAGCDVYLNKPLNTRTLPAQLNAVTSRPSDLDPPS